MMTLREFAEQEFRGLDIVSVSQPEPVLLDRNVMAVTDDVDQAREAVLALEDLEIDDSRLGLVVLEPPHRWGPEWKEGKADPEGATKPVTRAPMGAATGAVLGALVIGVLAAFLGNGSTGMVGLIVGAVAGGVLGAIIAVFAGLGGSDAVSGDVRVAQGDAGGPRLLAHERSGRGKRGAQAPFLPIMGRPLRRRCQGKDEAPLTWLAPFGPVRSASVW